MDGDRHDNRGQVFRRTGQTSWRAVCPNCGKEYLVDDRDKFPWKQRCEDHRWRRERRAS